jgi:hypothetical protein
MSKLTKQFDVFLSEIEPGGKAVRFASKAHTRVRDHLASDEKFKQHLRDSFLYGSYKRSTAICEIKDVDIVLLTDFDPNEKENTPQRVLRKVKDALNRHYKDTKNQQYQRRSIRVDDPLPEDDDASLTLDVIPAFAPRGDNKPLLVPDRELKKWVPSHPKGHIEHTTALNAKDCGNGMFVPLVKIMKYWWKYQCEVIQPDVERPKPKGFWIECLTGECFDRDQKDYATHFMRVLENLSNKYSDADSVPTLEDPGLKNGHTIKTSMTIEEFHTFMDAVNGCLDLAEAALEEEDDYQSGIIWREIFGNEFPLPEQNQSIKSIAHPFPKGFQVGDFSHRQSPVELNIIDRGSYSIPIRIKAGLYWGKSDDKINNRRYKGPFSVGSELPVHHWIKYEVEGYIPDGYQIYWQVVNTGAHARSQVGGLRGEIFRGERVQWERSRFTGVHWIECYLVNPYTRVCEGKAGPFYVIFDNPSFPFRR